MCQPNKPSCFHCIHATVTGPFLGTQYEPPEPEEASCNILDEICELTSGKYEQMEEIDFDPDKMPELCGRFSPKMIDKCGNCKRPINKPAYTWEHWANCDEPVPACSDECKMELKEKFEAWLERHKL